MIWILILNNTVCFSANVEYNIYDYYIKNADVDIVVNDKREFIVTEKIDVYFNVCKHGIIRKIPLKSSLENIKIKDISVEGAYYEVSKDSNYSQIKIGSSNKTVIGDVSYIIKYTLSHYEDGEKYGDNLYLNVWGTEWDVPVLNFNSTINYPSNFNFESINITSGYEGSYYNELADYTLNSNVVEIKSKEIISPYNGVTVKVFLFFY